MTDLRKIILKVLLWSLALAALAGVLAVLVSSDVIWRVVATGFLTAAAALIMMPLSIMVDRKKLQSAGLFGIVSVVVQFILVLALIWEVHTVVPGRRGWESVMMTIGAVGVTSVAAMVSLIGLHRPDARIAGFVGLVLTAVVFVFAMLGSWVPPKYDEECWGTAWTFAAFGTAAAAALIGAGTGDRRYWRWLGVAASAGAVVLLLREIWANKGELETWSLFAAASVYVAWANLIMRVPLKPGQGWLRLATLIAGAATAVLSELIIFDYDRELVTRGDAAAAILTACGTLALAVLARLNRRVDFEPMPREMRNITLFCPRCRKKQSLELGGAECKSCGLRIEVRAEEPRCAQCGYLLYQLTSDNCPECGTPIRHDAQAAAD
ncbi:MAG: zinc ribbon domain-containing protein [Planctomycetota bacterium]